MKNQFIRLYVALLFVAVIASSSFAAGEPLDLTATGVTIAGYVAAAAGAGVALLAAMYGVRVIIRAFKSVK